MKAHNLFVNQKCLISMPWCLYNILLANLKSLQGFLNWTNNVSLNPILKTLVLGFDVLFTRYQTVKVGARKTTSDRNNSTWTFAIEYLIIFFSLFRLLTKLAKHRLCTFIVFIGKTIAIKQWEIMQFVERFTGQTLEIQTWRNAT